MNTLNKYITLSHKKQQFYAHKVRQKASQLNSSGTTLHKRELQQHDAQVLRFYYTNILLLMHKCITIYCVLNCVYNL